MGIIKLKLSKNLKRKMKTFTALVAIFSAAATALASNPCGEDRAVVFWGSHECLGSHYQVISESSNDPGEGYAASLDMQGQFFSFCIPIGSSLTMYDHENFAGQSYEYTNETESECVTQFTSCGLDLFTSPSDHLPFDRLIYYLLTENLQPKIPIQ